MSDKKRIDFLPSIGQAIIKGMCAETLKAIDQDKGHPHYCLAGLFRLANIPLDFQSRWNSERAIQDVLIKARDYGFVAKSCNGRWKYTGPEVKEATKRREKRRKEAENKIFKFLESKGLKVEKDSLRVRAYQPNKGKTTVRIVLPKNMWIK